jgi:hypothetical protein
VINNISMKDIQDEIFWAQEPSILFDWNKLAEIVPKSNMTSTQKLNALSRLILYGGIITYLYQMDSLVIIITGIGLFVTYLLSKNIEDFKEEIDDDIEFNNRKCQKVSDDNPFMNVLPVDYDNNPNRAEACSHSSENVRTKVNEIFNKKFPRDSDDIFGKNNSFRQFYTMPATTIPNNRDKFQKWLYNIPKTCKEGGILPKRVSLFNK